MALDFNKTAGKAIKEKVDQYQYKNGDQHFRLVGDLLPRYVYWVKGDNNKDIPMECLSFDRQKEKFTNMEKDWVREYYPDLKCGWAYAGQVIDPESGKVVVVNLKKQLLEQIITAAEDLGDPTDPQEGWDIYFRRVKTGPQAYNVKYELLTLKCKKRPLSEEELELIKELKSMDEVLPRPTADAQKELLERIARGQTEEASSEDQIPADAEQALDL